MESLEGRRLLATVPISQGADYTLGIDDSGTFAVMQMEHAEYDSWVADPTYSDQTQRIYESFPDEFDFIFLIPNETEIKANFSGQAVRVQNDTSGIGISQYDSTSNYGSEGRLQTAIYLGRRNSLRWGPALHEIMHRWANYYPEFRPQTSHWGFSNVGGQLGGWAPGSLTDLGNGVYEADGPESHPWFSTFANGGNGVPFSEFELYLMGLIDAEDVSHDIKIARDAEFVDYSEGQFSASSIETHKMVDLVAANGRRSPQPEAAQTSFRSLVVLVTPDPVSDDVADAFADDVTLFSAAGSDGSQFTYNFWEATGGRATMQMDGLLDLVKPIAGTDRIGVHRSDRFLMDINGDGRWGPHDANEQFGSVGSTPVVGDWNGDGFDEIGVHRGSGFWLDTNGDGRWNEGDTFRRFGQVGNTPVIGDWNGDGIDDLGVHTHNAFWLDASGDGQWDAADRFHRFGQPGNLPVVGDWDGDGDDDLGVFSEGRFWLDTSGDGIWNPRAGDRSYRFGNEQSTPLSGDFDGDGTDSIGVHAGNRFWLDISADGQWGAGDKVLSYGQASDTAIIGNWRTTLYSSGSRPNSGPVYDPDAEDDHGHVHDHALTDALFVGGLF